MKKALVDTTRQGLGLLVALSICTLPLPNYISAQQASAHFGENNSNGMPEDLDGAVAWITDRSSPLQRAQVGAAALIADNATPGQLVAAIRHLNLHVLAQDSAEEFYGNDTDTRAYLEEATTSANQAVATLAASLLAALDGAEGGSGYDAGSGDDRDDGLGGGGSSSSGDDGTGDGSLDSGQNDGSVNFGSN